MTLLFRITLRIGSYSIIPFSFHRVRKAWFGFHILYITKEHKGGRALLSFTRRAEGMFTVNALTPLKRPYYEFGFLFLNMRLKKEEK